MTRRPTIGILTGGGDCPGLNAVIRAATKSASRMGYDCIGFLRGYEGLVEPVSYMPLDAHNTAGILLQGGTILGSTNKGRFTALVGEGDRVQIDRALLDEVAMTVKQLALAGLICVGGDGSLGIAQQFHEHGIPVVGVPKTIDNDLGATAFTFGFDSAVATATDALDRLHTTAASHERVMVLEVMGRHAGWIALHAGIAGGGDVILLPEIPWTFENVCRKVIERDAEGKRFTLIVVAEGAHVPGGGLVHAGSGDCAGQVKLGGIGEIVCREVASRLGREVRTVVLGHHEGRFGEMVCYRPPDIASVTIAEAIGRLSTVDPHGSAVQAARALGIGFGDGEDSEPFSGGRGAVPRVKT
ncbi:MAG: ATP-dependent 6-phosphofructokinase [Planctomycetia bacterium]|nr:ATP-dependent 6-phosphofructokinase [Planctomycetia bacterium]